MLFDSFVGFSIDDRWMFDSLSLYFDAVLVGFSIERRLAGEMDGWGVSPIDSRGISI